MKVSVVTGGAHGIGKAIALALLEQGHTVVVLDVNDQYINVLKCETLDRPLHALVCDVGVAAETARAMGVVATMHKKIDCMVNNAGISRFKPIDETSIDEWNRVLSVNLGSVFYMAKFGKRLLTEGSAIVNIASTRALMSEPDSEAYGASKGGVAALTHALAISLGPRTRVNCISPGWIELDSPSRLSENDHAQHPCGRAGRVDDITEMVLFLLSEKAGFVTGQNFVVDGGMTKKMIYAEG